MDNSDVQWLAALNMRPISGAVIAETTWAQIIAQCHIHTFIAIYWIRMQDSASSNAVSAGLDQWAWVYRLSDSPIVAKTPPRLLHTHNPRPWH